MTEEELTKKLNEVNRDLNEYDELIKNLDYKSFDRAEQFVNKCQNNDKYNRFILKNKISSNLIGTLTFSQLNYKCKLNVLYCIQRSLIEYLLELNSEI